MPQRQPNKRVGVLSQRLSEEESPCTGSSAELLSRFLSSVDFSCPKPPRAWESNPLYKELKRSLQGTIHMQQVEEMLRERYRRASIMSTYASGQSTVTTISSAQSSSIPEHEPHCSDSTLDSEEPLWWSKQSTVSQGEDSSTYSDPSRHALPRPRSASMEISKQEELQRLERSGSTLKSKAGLEGLQGIWKLRCDEPVRLLDLCRLMELDPDEMERRENNIQLEIKLMSHSICVKSEIFGLYNVEVPINGEVSRIPRIDQHKGVMSAHVETKRMGLRLICTWDHPVAATRRDNYEVSSDGEKLTLTAYLMQRDGHYCKVKWQFEKRHDDA